MSPAIVIAGFASMLLRPLAAPPPTPSACLELTEVFYLPAGEVTGLQWTRIRNSCSVPVVATGVELRWSRHGRWDSGGVLALGQLGEMAPGECVTVGGPVSTAENRHPGFALAAAFQPELARPDEHATMEGLGLFKRGATVPFDAVFYGPSFTSSLVGTDGELVSEADLPQIQAGHSMWLSNERWYDSESPSPHSCLAP